jgi:hypothetical protein
VGALKAPPVIRAPNGVLQDVYEFHGTGQALLRPRENQRPDTVGGGRMERGYTSLYGTDTVPPDKRLVELAEGTHHIMLEKNRNAGEKSKGTVRNRAAFLDAGSKSESVDLIIDAQLPSGDHVHDG